MVHPCPCHLRGVPERSAGRAHPQGEVEVLAEPLAVDSAPVVPVGSEPADLHRQVGADQGGDGGLRGSLVVPLGERARTER